MNERDLALIECRDVSNNCIERKVEGWLPGQGSNLQHFG
jgi:hypothetical protein